MTAIIAVLFTGCIRGTTVIDDTEGYWLSQERGDVVFRDSNCGYYVVETNYGYTIIRSMNGNRPYEGNVLYGNFGLPGVRNYYNYSNGVLLTGDAVEVDLSYSEAQLAIEYYCPYMVGFKIKQSAASTQKQDRVVQ